MADNTRQTPTTETLSEDAPAIKVLGSARSGASHAHRHVHMLLFGLMGSGKSTVGRLVARELGRPFVDSDSIVELHSGRLPHEIADRSGLAELHQIEADAARHVLATSHAVVFAVSASLIDTITPEELDGKWSVWLDTPPEVLAERVSGGGPRPLLDSSPFDVLAEQHRVRTPRAHELVNLVVSTTDRTAVEVATLICEEWRRFAAGFERPGGVETPA